MACRKDFVACGFFFFFVWKSEKKLRTLPVQSKYFAKQLSKIAKS